MGYEVSSVFCTRNTLTLSKRFIYSALISQAGFPEFHKQASLLDRCASFPSHFGKPRSNEWFSLKCCSSRAFLPTLWQNGARKVLTESKVWQSALKWNCNQALSQRGGYVLLEWCVVGQTPGGDNSRLRGRGRSCGQPNHEHELLGVQGVPWWAHPKEDAGNGCPMKLLWSSSCIGFLEGDGMGVAVPRSKTQILLS